jgi:prevent-host-death family protein
MTVTEAARNFSDLINRVVYRGDVAILTRNGKPVARILPEGPTKTTGRQLAEFWRNRAPMSVNEAESFSNDLAQVRNEGNRPQRDLWAE